MSFILSILKLIGAAIILLGLYAVYCYASLPNVAIVQTCFTTNMNQVKLCPKSKNYAKLSEISPNIRNAIIISEDAAFYSHHGFDYDEMENSFKTNWAKGAFARGGSTISQQLAKNLFLSKDKSITRKLKEYLLTKRLEERYKKDFLLEKYLNVVELAKDVYGVKDGSDYYFHKAPSQVTPLEAAFLAFLLPNPQKYGVSYKKKELTPFARARLKDILYKMNYYKKISAEDYQASSEQLESLFKPIAQMQDEPSQQEINSGAVDTDDGTYDLTDTKDKQKHSIDELRELPPPDSDDDQKEDSQQ